MWEDCRITMYHLVGERGLSSVLKSLAFVCDKLACKWRKADCPDEALASAYDRFRIILEAMAKSAESSNL